MVRFRNESETGLNFDSVFLLFQTSLYIILIRVFWAFFLLNLALKGFFFNLIMYLCYFYNFYSFSRILLNFFVTGLVVLTKARLFKAINDFIRRR
jgi:hypothetical protein